MHNENVEILQTLKEPKKKGKPRKPFTPKEKKIKSKPFKIKKKMMPTKVEKPSEKAPAKKKPVKKEVVKKETIKKPIVKKPKAKAEIEAPSDELLITKLNGMGPATAKKFEEIGVTTIKQLIGEDPTELSMLVKGASEERIKRWVEEGKKLLK